MHNTDNKSSHSQDRERERGERESCPHTSLCNQTSISKFSFSLDLSPILPHQISTHLSWCGPHTTFYYFPTTKLPEMSSRHLSKYHKVLKVKFTVLRRTWCVDICSFNCMAIPKAKMLKKGTWMIGFRVHSFFVLSWWISSLGWLHIWDEANLCYLLYRLKINTM